MQSVNQEPLASKKMVLAGRIMSGAVVLFMLFDSTLHVLKPAPVVAAFIQLGYPISASVSLGILELMCAVAYAIPRTAVVGAILLTGYLGGAVATHVRVGDPLFDTLFPVGVGALVWGGLFLRDARLRALIPLRS